MREDLLNPQLVSEYIATYHAAERSAIARYAAAQGDLRKQLRDAEAKIKRLVAAIAAGVDVAEIRDGLQEVSAERDSLKAELDEADAERVVTMHPRLADNYRKRIGALGEALEGPGEQRAEAKATLRSLVDCVVVIPAETGRGVELELRGRLAEIIRFAQNKKAPAEAGADCTLMLVAGARSRLCSALSVVRI
jgi:site-specific DNA recombinase